MAEKAHLIPFAEDDSGNACMVPSAAVKLRIKKKQPDGKPGRPRNVCIDGVPFEPALPVTSATVAVLPDGDYIADALDENGKRVGARVQFSIEHLRSDEPTQSAPVAGESAGVIAELIEMNKQLQLQTAALHEALIKTVNQVTVALDKMTTAQVEMTKNLAPVVEAAATTIEAARGGGFSKMANEIQAVMDLMPEQENNQLETVLSSPLVMGVASMLQKYMAEAAKNAAESAVEFGGHSDNEAARQARRFLKLQAERERLEAQGE